MWYLVVQAIYLVFRNTMVLVILEYLDDQGIIGYALLQAYIRDLIIRKISHWFSKK